MRKLFINGKVYLEKGIFCDTVGIKNDIIDFTGIENDADKSEYDEIIDLNGRLVLPGLIDSHIHLVYGSVMKTRLDCSAARDKSELIEHIKTYIIENQDKEWIIGGNLNSSLIEIEDGFLEKIESSKPVFITNYDFHSGYCNYKAMQETGLLNKIKTFSEDLIPKDKNGKFTGVVKEAAMNHVFSHLPEETPEDKVKAVRMFIKILHSYGITGVSDIVLREGLDVYKLLLNDKDLKIRIGAYVPIEDIDKIDEYTKFLNIKDKTIFDIKGLKAFYDGALGSETGLFKENYKGKDYKGYRTEMAESGRLKELAIEADSRKIQVIIHAIGDKAVEEVLNIAKEMNEKNGTYDRRFRIEHAQHIDDNDLNKFKDYNVIASVQPVHLKYDAGIVKIKLNETTAKRTHNYIKLINKGVLCCFGTDFPIAPINPYENIQTALTREGFYPEFCIPVQNSLECYTINGAFSNFTDKFTGSLKAGKKADMVILNDDLFELDADSINRAQVYQTYFNGEKVYPDC